MVMILSLPEILIPFIPNHIWSVKDYRFPLPRISSTNTLKL